MSPDIVALNAIINNTAAASISAIAAPAVPKSQ
jgi:hypothetical protein